jgi:hypothetical protein
VSWPLVPLITMGYEPAGVDDPVLTFNVDDPDPVTKFGVNAALAPVGRPLTLKSTVLINPVPAVTVAVYDVALPGATVRAAGVAVTVKLGTSTVRVTGELVSPPLSVTVNDAMYDPGVEYVTLPGVATVADAGLPPGKLQAYALIVPSESVPVPAKNTDCPASTVGFPAGLEIVAVGR